MKKEDTHTIFQLSDCISEEVLFAYIDNQLLPKEQHRVEKHLLECELCTDAFEGLKLIKERNVIAETKELVINQIKNSTTKQSAILSIRTKRVFAIAASIALLIGSVFLFQFFNTQKEELKLAANKMEIKTFSSPDVANEKSLESQSEVTTYTAEEVVTVNKNASLKKEEQIKMDGLMKEQPAKTGEYRLEMGKVLNEKENSTDFDKANSKQKEESKKTETTLTMADAETTSTTEKDAKVSVYSPPQVSNSSVGGYEGKNEESAEKKITKTNDAMSTSPSVQQNQIESIDESVAYQSTLETSEIADSVFSIVEVMPEFKGGKDSMQAFISKNFKYPKTMPEGSMNLTIYITLMIDKVGNVLQPKILKGINKDLDDEAIRVVILMPAWKPGTQNGKAVKVKMNIPIKLK